MITRSHKCHRACPPWWEPRRGVAIQLMLTITALILLLSATSFAGETVCVGCHEAEAKDWKESIHFKNGISCHNCHGGDPKNADNAMDPKDGFVGKPSTAGIPAFCGKCHAGVKDNYLKSDHGTHLTRGGPNCVTCHTAHKQKRASISLISEEFCARCHSFERAAKIKNAMLTTEAEITELESKIEDLKVQGYDVRPSKKSLFAARNQFHRLTHVVDADLISRETSGIQTEIGRIKTEIAGDESKEAKRKIAGGIFVVFLLISALILWWYRNTVLDE